jgi:hypothetical protein
MIKLTNLLKEIIDIYSPEELNSKGINYIIEKDTSNEFIAKLNYKDLYYYISIRPIFKKPRPTLNFAVTDERYSYKDYDTLTNSPSTPKMLASIFGLISYWVNKHNIKEFDYSAMGDVRNKIYFNYIKKHFPNFKHTQEGVEEWEKVEVWKKI